MSTEPAIYDAHIYVRVPCKHCKQSAHLWCQPSEVFIVERGMVCVTLVCPACKTLCRFYTIFTEGVDAR